MLQEGIQAKTAIGTCRRLCPAEWGARLGSLAMRRCGRSARSVEIQSLSSNVFPAPKRSRLRGPPHSYCCLYDPVCGTINCVGDCGRWSDDDTGSCSTGTWADVVDTDSHWQAQCTNGGATVRCEWKRPECNECAAGLVTWTVNSTTCQSSVARTSHLQVRALQDTSMHALSWPTGSATFTCEDG